jgi:PAS domain S-box-containing protein
MKSLEAMTEYEEFIALTDDAVISLDTKQSIIMFNPAAEHIFGYAAEETLGRDIGSLLPARFRKTHAAYVRGFANSVETSHRMDERSTVWGLRKNGEEFPAIASILKTGPADNIKCMVILRDITAVELLRKELQDRIHELEAFHLSLKQENQKLKHTENLLDELFKQSHS